MGAYVSMGMYRHMGAYGCTGECKDFWGVWMYGVYKCMMECTYVWGVQKYGGIWMYGEYTDEWGLYRCMGHKNVWGVVILGLWTWECMGVYRHMGAYGCTCLPTIPEGI